MTKVLVVVRGFCVTRNYMAEQLNAQALKPDCLCSNPVSFSYQSVQSGACYCNFSVYPILPIATTKKEKKRSLCEYQMNKYN